MKTECAKVYLRHLESNAKHIKVQYEAKQKQTQREIDAVDAAAFGVDFFDSFTFAAGFLEVVDVAILENFPRRRSAITLLRASLRFFLGNCISDDFFLVC